MGKNTNNDRTKRPPAFFEKLILVMNLFSIEIVYLFPEVTVGVVN